MSDVLRDLVVSLSLDSDNFSRNIKSVNKQIAEAESSFKLAGAGVKDFEHTTAGLNARLSTLGRQVSLQKSVVTQYERALDAANKRLTDSYNKQNAYSKRLKEAQTAHQGLKEQVSAAAQQVRTYSSTLGENDSATIAARANLDALKKEYAASAAEIRKLKGQNAALERSTQNAADSVSVAGTKANEARARLKELEQQLKLLESGWYRASVGLEKFSKKMTSAGQSWQTVGRTLTGFGTTPVLTLGVSAVKASMDFETTFTSVRKTVDATEEEFDELAAASKQMSTEIATSTDVINEVMAAGGQLGVDTDYLAGFTRTMIDLSNSTEDLSANDAATAIAQFVNVMGTDQVMFSNIGSSLVALGNNFATTEGETMKMAQRLAGAGKQVGLTEPQILGFAAALSSVGIEAEAGGTAFSKALINMELAATTGGQALDDFAMVAGMTADEFKALWEADPAAAFIAFIEGLAQLDEEGESAITVLDEIGISEVRLRDTMLRSVNATEVFNDAQETANQAWEENVALTEEANKRYSTTESRFTNLKNTAVLFAQRIGDDLNPTINKLIDGVSGLLEKFMAMDEAQRLSIIKFAAYVAAAGPVISTTGKLMSGIGSAAGSIGKFTKTVGKAGGGLAGFGKTLAKSPSFWVAVAAAVAAGTYALIDYASGAKAAREALEELENTASNWQNNPAETFYGNNEGLAFFGMSTEDFNADKAIKSGQEWFDGLIKVWTDGAKETDDIVNQWTDSFTDGTDRMREVITEQKQAAEEGGYTGLVDEMQADLDTLDEIDAEVAALLKKRQNGTFTEEDQIKLNELIDNRETIQIKYDLVPDTGGTGGFEGIRKGVNAEIARAQALGKDADVSVYQNAMVAAAEGMAEVNRQIDENYDKEYELIQMMEDGEEKEAAMADLNARYTEERLAAGQAYAGLLQDITMPVWNSEGIQEAKGDMDYLLTFLTEYNALSPDERKAKWGELADFTAGMDEGAMTEYVMLLTTIQSLLDSGMTEEEVAAMFPEIDFSQALQDLAMIQDYLLKYSGDDEALGTLSVMFGTALPEEVLTIATDLDMTGAQERWNEFASNPGAITTELVITSHLALTGYDMIAYQAFVENNPVEVQGFVRVGEIYGDDPGAVVNDPNAKVWVDGVEVEVTPEVSNQITADTLAVLDSDGTLHVLVTPEISGTAEAVEATRNVATEVPPDTKGYGGKSGTWNLTGYDAEDLGIPAMELVDIGLERIRTYVEEAGNWFLELFDPDLIDAEAIDEQLDAEWIGTGTLSQLIVYVQEMLSFLEQGGELAEEDVENFRKIIEFLSGLQEAGVGGNILAGVAEGMVDYGWDTTAETVAEDLEEALNNALDINSPSRRTMPIGEYAAAGVGEGMLSYDMEADVERVADRIVSAAIAALTGNKLRSVGMQAMAGLAAGIRAGRTGVVAAMRSVAQAAVDAAKSALDIHSPSRVFRDEVGVMSMKGFGEGVREESIRQAATIRNAARYLTNEARNGSVAPVSNDNRRTYNSDNSMTLSFAGANFNVRNEQDVRELAIEIASLTRRNQRGRGFRRA